MKIRSISLKLFATVLVGTSIQGHAFTMEEWARVKSSEPIFGQSTNITRQQCTPQWVSRNIPQQQDSANIGGAIIGGLIGGVLGNQVGQGSGNTAATILGAGAGAVIGERMIGDSSGQQTFGSTTEMVQVENCVMVNELQPASVVGYRVVLDHNGRDIVFQMQNPPRSDRVRVRVQITPLP